MTVNVILQARMTSSRLPGKVLMDICGAPMLARQIERIRRARQIDRIIIATSAEEEDEPVALLAQRLGVDCFRGSLRDVLGRFCLAAMDHQSDHVMRLTGDCPLIDPGLIDDLITFHRDGGYDISSLGIERTYPHGLDAEVMTFAALQPAGAEADRAYDREHVTPYLYTHPDRFRIGSMRQTKREGHMRWTVDYPEDLALVRRVFAHFLDTKPDFRWTDVKAWLATAPDVQALNAVHRIVPEPQPLA
jgi:spore coat polysaccharide biosynthesis protein SpsF